MTQRTRTSIRLVAVAIVAAACLATAQAAQKPVQKPAPKPTPAPRPNFAGRWIVISPEKGKGLEQIVTHDDKMLAIENTRQGPALRQTFLLDGLEHKRTMAARGSEIAITYRAQWEGASLVITSTQLYSNGMKLNMRDVWSIDAKGQLVIDYSESGPGGAAPPMKVIHVRKQGPERRADN